MMEFVDQVVIITIDLVEEAVLVEEDHDHLVQDEEVEDLINPMTIKVVVEEETAIHIQRFDHIIVEVEEEVVEVEVEGTVIIVIEEEEEVVMMIEEDLVDMINFIIQEDNIHTLIVMAVEVLVAVEGMEEVGVTRIIIKRHEAILVMIPKNQILWE